MDESLIVRRETQVAAPPATVFAFLTDPQKILSWMGAEADTDAHPGGLYLVKDIAGRPGRTARGEFREVVPVHRLAYSFGWDDDANVPPGSSLVEIDLMERNGGTLVRMTHTGLPNAYERDGHAKGLGVLSWQTGGRRQRAAIRASTEGRRVTAANASLSFPRKRESSAWESVLDARFRGHDTRNCRSLYLRPDRTRPKCQAQKRAMISAPRPTNAHSRMTSAPLGRTRTEARSRRRD